MKYTELTTEQKFRVLNQVVQQTGYRHDIIEKDWWVTMTLKALFQTSCQEFLSFKGGTSLSKGWHLIDRFSEDIDLSLHHSFFGIESTSTTLLLLPLRN